MHLTTPSEHQVLVFLVQITVLLGLSRLFGQLFRRIGQPRVVGEIAAGVVLGPSVLGQLAPDAMRWLFPGDAVESAMLFTVGWLGVILLLIVTGFETDLSLISRLGKAAAYSSIGGLLVPVIVLGVVGITAPASLRAPGTTSGIFAGFLVASLAVTSLPIIGQILSELRLLRRNFGQLTLAVGMTDDVMGWILLGLVAGVATSGEFDGRQLLTSLGWVMLFLVLAALIGQRIVDWMLLLMRRLGIGLGGWVTFAIGFGLVVGIMTQAIGVEALLGAFIAGVLLGRSRYIKHDVEEQLETFASAFLSPIFFATAGLRVDLTQLNSAQYLLWGLLVLVAATASKIFGVWAGARAAGLDSREGLAIGAAVNTRGSMGIIIGTIGLSLEVLNDASYTVIVIVSLLCAMMSPPLLRIITRGWSGGPEEVERLRREEELEGNVFLKSGRALLPTRGGDSARFAATVLDSTLPEGSPVTIAAIDAIEPSRLIDIAQRFPDRPVESRQFDDDPVPAILRQAGLGYSFIAIGTDVSAATDFSEVVQAAILESPLPVLLVRSPLGQDRPIHRVMLPVSARLPDRAAAEVAIAIARHTQARLDLVSIRPPGSAETEQRWRSIRPGVLTAGRGSSNQPAVAERILAAAAKTARDGGVWPRRMVVEGDVRGLAIVETARQRNADLVVIGVEAQDAAGDVYLGQTAAHILAAGDIGLAIVALGPR